MKELDMMALKIDRYPTSLQTSLSGTTCRDVGLILGIRPDVTHRISISDIIVKRTK
jgi:hypothetical protein